MSSSALQAYIIKDISLTNGGIIECILVVAKNMNYG